LVTIKRKFEGWKACIVEYKYNKFVVVAFKE